MIQIALLLLAHLKIHVEKNVSSLISHFTFALKSTVFHDKALFTKDISRIYKKFIPVPMSPIFCASTFSTFFKNNPLVNATYYQNMGTICYENRYLKVCCVGYCLSVCKGFCPQDSDVRFLKETFDFIQFGISKESFQDIFFSKYHEKVE